MAKLTADDILAIADECDMECPRVIIRKLSSGQIAYALKYGLGANRKEIVFDRSTAADAVRAALASSQ